MEHHIASPQIATAATKRVDEIVCELDLPPCPTILTQMLRETRAEEPDIGRVSRLIGQDAALASAALRVVNSPFYGLRTQASTVERAVLMLGLNNITQLITGLLLRQAFPSLSGPAMQQYWKRSMATAMIAPLICRELWRDGTVAATFALFRDCGMPVMLLRYPTYTDIFDGSALSPDHPPLELENERYPVNHARLGAQMARSWHLPDALCNAVLHHHDAWSSDGLPSDMDADARFLIATAYAAERLYALATHGPCPEWEAVCEWVLAELGLTKGRFEVIASSVAASINQM
jgi:putative nucleotidyltransferase with HDIG domain